MLAGPLQVEAMSLIALALKPQRFFKASLELFLGDRFLQDGYMREVREANGVSATNDKWDAPRHQRAGDMTGYFDIETHVKRGAVNFLAAINDCQSIRHRRCDAGGGTAQFLEHFRGMGSDQRLIFDDKNADSF